MDWIDPRHAAMAKQTEAEITTKTKHNRQKGGRSKDTLSKDTVPKDTVPKDTVPKLKPMSKQVTAALSQPLEVWASAYDHAIARLKWPNGVSAENLFLWSALMQEQAEILVRAGMSAKKLAVIISESNSTKHGETTVALDEVIGLMDQPLEKVAFGWIHTADAFPKSALGVAALGWHLPEHARRPGNEWLTQWMQLVVERMVTYSPDLEESVICHLVLQCEMPLLIGLATSASQRTALHEASKAMDNLAEYIERSEEAPAPWLAHGATYLRASLACVVRCRVLANALGLRKWYPPQQRALAGLLKHAARWARPDGTQLLAAGVTSPRTKSIWEALVKQTKNSKGLQAVMHYSGLLTTPGLRAKEQVKQHKLPPLTAYCPDAAGVVMQSDWSKKGSRCSIDFSDSEICLEVLGPKGQAILAGEWTVGVELEQQAQLQLDEWSEICWFSDDDVDYLELEAKFGQHAQVQRQALFFREDRMLLLADALLCDQVGPWSLASRIPLAANVSFEPTNKTTEGFIVAPNGARCLTLPLHLPEWRRQLTGQGLETDNDMLTVNHQHTGQRLYAATLISLASSPAKHPYTWRQLTVGDELQIASAEDAVAFRVQIGKQQWLIYRSLTPPKRRTALGMHTIAEFYAGRFDTDTGDADTLLAVEPTS